MKRIPVNLLDYQHDTLRKVSYEENKSISDIIRKSVDLYIKARDKQMDDEYKKMTDNYKVLVLNGVSVEVKNVHKSELSELIESILSEDKHILSVAPIYESV